MSLVRGGASVVFQEDVKLEVMEMAPLITFSLKAFGTGVKLFTNCQHAPRHTASCLDAYGTRAQVANSYNVHQTRHLLIANFLTYGNYPAQANYLNC